MATTLIDKEIARAAEQIGCDTAAILAVGEVESNNVGFKNGSIVIGFNNDDFTYYTKKKVTGSGKEAYDKAYKIDPEKAMFSTSWGRFQMRGYNFDACGYPTIEAFVADMKASEQAQLNAFINYVNKRKIDESLASHDWASFALVYNKRSDYASKLAKAYNNQRTTTADTTQTGITHIIESPVSSGGLSTKTIVLLIAAGGLVLCVLVYALLKRSTDANRP